MLSILSRQAGSGLDLDQLDVTRAPVPELARAINPGMARQAPQVTLVLMKRNCRGVRVYEQINVLPPASIGKKSAHIIGGGIGGLSAAAFLVDDAHMPGRGHH